MDESFYKNRSYKVLDFLVGFIIVPIILYGIFTLVADHVNSTLSWGISAGTFIFMIVGSVYLSFKKSRRYIGIGLISAVIIPLLIFGSCLLLINNF